MHPQSVVVISLICSLAAQTLGAAERSKTTNAALTYWQAIALLPELKGDGQKAVDDYARVDPTSEAVKNVLASSRNSLRLMKRASALETCDWGVDYELDGFNALLPHLSKIRWLARFALLDARSEFSQKQWRSGIDTALATFRMAKHTGGGPGESLINALVERAIESMVVDMLAAVLPDMPSETRQQLAATLPTLPPATTTHVAIQAERQFAAGWIQRKLAEDGEDAFIRWLSEASPDGAAVAKQLKGGPLRKRLDEADKAYDEIVETCRLPYDQFASAAAKLEARLTTSDNPLVTLLTPAVLKARNSEFRVEVRRRMLRAAIEELNGNVAAFHAVHDLASDQPFEKRAADGGFELVSKVTGADGKPVTLRIGR